MYMLKVFLSWTKSNEFLSLPPIAKYNASRSIKQKIAPATSEGVSQETCTHFTCRYMHDQCHQLLHCYIHLKRELQITWMTEIIRNGCLTYPVYDTVWYKPWYDGL